MSARIDVVNLALTWLGANQITSLEDDSVEAKVMKANYEHARDATLEAHEWSFAIRRFTPAKLADPPDWGAANAFAIPSDILRVLRVEANRGSPLPAGVTSQVGNVSSSRRIDRRMQSDWLIESRQIITDEDSILCRGIRRIEDEGIFSPLFVHAFAAHLATLTAYTLTESNGKFNAMSALYQLKIQEAKTRDGLQGSSKRLRQRSLQNVR